MSRIQYQMFAAADERFGPRAFDGQIGNEVGVVLPDGTVDEATIAGAVVAEGGLSVTLTLDMPAGALSFLAIQAPMPT